MTSWPARTTGSSTCTSGASPPAYLYGAPDTPGATGDLGHLNAFFLLTARPEVYNLPVAPTRASNRVRPALTAGLTAMAAFAATALLAFAASAATQEGRR